jgi:hypothetical protein
VKPADCHTFVAQQLDAEQELATRAKRMRYALSTDAPWERDRIIADQVGGDSPAIAVHRMIAIFANPDRILDDVKVKRLILALHGEDDVCDAHNAAYETIPCDTLLALAQLYAGRPGWQPQWLLADT